ncbi:hypothetical protein LNQ03_27480 [Klebsiella pneumoniae subsp. pneumoniae]|nr:hypothetical protein [Klebsiella pneumoniae subsp. pneumoniae]
MHCRALFFCAWWSGYGRQIFNFPAALAAGGAALGGAMLLPGVMQAAWAGGSDRPEQTTVRVGFIPLTGLRAAGHRRGEGVLTKNMASPWWRE